MVMCMTQEFGRGPCAATMPKAEQNPIMSDHSGVARDASRFTQEWGGSDALEVSATLLGTVLFLTEQYTDNVLGTLALDHPFV